MTRRDIHAVEWTMATHSGSLSSTIAIVAIGLVALGLGAACNGSTDPFQGIKLRTEVSPAVVAVGDTVTFRAIMRNRSSDEFDAFGCGPPALFELRGSPDAVIHPIRLDVGFTCEGHDYHRLEPHETDSVVRKWRVELSLGEWSVRSGFRSGAGLVRLSPPVTLVVQ